jgi:hypothetical protein
VHVDLERPARALIRDVRHWGEAPAPNAVHGGIAGVPAEM